MPNIDDVELRKSSEESEAPRPPQHLWRWGIVAALLVLTGVTARYVLRDRSTTTVPPAGPSESVEIPPEVRSPLGNAPMPIVLPPLDESDEIVRKLVAALSSHPRLAAWLATDGVIRNFAVVVVNIADGEGPAVHLRRLRPAARFEVSEGKNGLSINPRSYERYTPLAAAAASVDPAGTARLYATLKPLIEEAHRELGHPNTSFDTTLERAIVRLLSTPVLDNPVYVEPQGIVYGFRDKRVQSLTAAQRQFLRFGPQNVRLIQRSLRDVAAALGIPADRLPSPPDRP